MKTNVVMKSADRELFGITIKQQTKDGQSLSITDLQKAYETARWQYGWTDRKVSHIMGTSAFTERCFYVLKEQGSIKADFPVFMEMVKNEGIVNVLKGLGVWKTKGRAENKSVYCDPYIWVMLAMELNPTIYAKVVIWLTDSLIMDRVIAGSNFLTMNIAISKIIPNPNYPEYCREINNKVFGKHERGIRDNASAEQLRHISDIEKFIAQSIGFGMCKNEDHLYQIIRNFNLSPNKAAA